MAVKSDGTVWAWGRNEFGALGTGNTIHYITPVQVSGMAGVTAVAAGNNHNIALKSDGTVWGWGRNDYGQLGIGMTSLYSTTAGAGGSTTPSGAVTVN